MITVSDYDDNMEKPYLWRRANRAHPITNKAPISMRIVIKNFPRAEFSTGVFATEAEWNAESQRLQVVRGMSKAEQKLLDDDNELLIEKVRSARKVYRAYRSQGGNPSPADLREVLRGKPARDLAEKKLTYAFDLLAKQSAEKKRTTGTLSCIAKHKRIVEEFLAHGKQKGLLADQVDRAWCRRFERWLLSLPWKGSTIRKCMADISRALDILVDEGVILENKTKDYVFLSEIPTPLKRHLTKEELERFQRHRFGHPTNQRVADCFLFCCYTGLSHVDYVRFAREPDTFIRFVPDLSGRMVKGFLLVRQKVLYRGKENWAPLFPEANALLLAYNNALPVYTKRYTNGILKKIADELAASGPFHLLDLAHKDARSTFTQRMREQTDKKTSAHLGQHTEQVNQKHYSSESATEVLKALYGFNIQLTYN